MCADRSDPRAPRAPLRVAVIDSGIDAAALGRGAAVIGAARFALSAAEGGRDSGGPQVRQLPPVRDPLGHGTDMARLILAAAPGVQLLDAQIFADVRPVAGGAHVAVVAAAIDWAVAQGAQLINLSLGLREDHWALRHACAVAHTAGVLLVASSPARGGPVYPAAYPGVVAVTGDARCAEGQWSLLDSSPGIACGPAALIGAGPGARTGGDCGGESVGHSVGHSVSDSVHHAARPPCPGGGASYAAARVCGLLARWLQARSPVGASAARAALALEHLAAGAAFRGRERHCPEVAA